MNELEKIIKRTAKRKSPCALCAFWPGENAAWLCCAPWNDFAMEDNDIDPCYEGVHQYITGYPAQHLRQLITERARRGVAPPLLRDNGLRQLSANNEKSALDAGTSKAR